MTEHYRNIYVDQQQQQQEHDNVENKTLVPTDRPNEEEILKEMETQSGNGESVSTEDSATMCEQPAHDVTDKDTTTVDVSPSSPVSTNATTTAASPSTSAVNPPSTVSPSTSAAGPSYIGLISRAILSSADRRLALGDIYNALSHMLPDRYNNNSKAWRNSVRHNLSLNECFVKVGKPPNGKGNYWAIHPACVGDFSRGDYRRRHARRRALGRRLQQQLTHVGHHDNNTLSPGSYTKSSLEPGYVHMAYVTVIAGDNCNSLTEQEIVSLLPTVYSRDLTL